MTEERQDIKEDFYSGDYKVIRVTVYEKDGVTKKNLVNCEMTYALFDDDDATYIRKSSANGATEIDVTDEPNGGVEIYLLGTDTLHIHGRFRHQMEVVDADDHAAVAMTGKVSIFKAFARRYRTAVLDAYLAGG